MENVGKYKNLKLFFDSVRLIESNCFLTEIELHKISLETEQRLSPSDKRVRTHQGLI